MDTNMYIGPTSMHAIHAYIDAYVIYVYIYTYLYTYLNNTHSHVCLRKRIGITLCGKCYENIT